MTNAQHTPGPWLTWQQPNEEGTNYWRIRTSNERALGDTLHGYCGEANARLIAAAPELLETLETLVRCIDMGSRIIADETIATQRYVDSARAAIAKAREIS